MAKLRKGFCSVHVLAFLFYITACGKTPEPTSVSTTAPVSDGTEIVSHVSLPPSSTLSLTPTRDSTPAVQLTPTTTNTPPSLAISTIPIERHILALDAGNVSGSLTRLLRMGTGDPNDIAFSPDGKYLVVATGLGVFFYDAQTFEQIKFIDVNSDVTLLAFNSDGTLLLLADYLRGNTAVSLWNMETGRKIITMDRGFDSWIQSIAYTDSGYVVAVGNEAECGVGCSADYFNPITRVWSADDGQVIFECPGDILGFSQDGSTLFFTGAPYRSLDLDSRTTQNTGVGEGPASIEVIPGSAITDYGQVTAISIDGKLKAVLDRTDAKVDLIDLQTDQPIETLFFYTTNSLAVEKVSLEGVETYIAATYDQSHRIVLWDLIRGVKIAASEPTTAFMQALAFSPDQRMLASVFDYDRIWLWDVATLQPVSQYNFGDQIDRRGNITEVRFTRDGTKLKLISPESTFELDLGSGQVVEHPYTSMVSAKGGFGTIDTLSGDIYNIAISPDSNSFSLNNVDANTSVLFPTVSGYQNDDFADIIAISPGGNYLAVGFSESPIAIWDIRTQMRISWMTGHQYMTTQVGIFSFHRLKFSPVSDLLLSVGADQTTQLWNIQNGRRLALLNVCCEAEFSPDGRVLVTSDNGVIRVWGIPPWP